MKKKAIIFDVDGTLLDTFGPSFRMDVGLISKYGGKIPSQQQYKEKIIDANWNKFYQEFAVPEKNVPYLLEEYAINFVKDPKPILGAHEILKQISSPHAISLCGDKFGLINRLSKGGLIKYFKEDNLYYPLSSKVRSLEEISKKDGLLKEEMIFVGDTISDIVDSKKYGIEVVVIANEHSYCTREMLESANPDYIIKDIRELKKIIGSEK